MNIVSLLLKSFRHIFGDMEIISNGERKSHPPVIIQMRNLSWRKSVVWGFWWIITKKSIVLTHNRWKCYMQTLSSKETVVMKITNISKRWKWIFSNVYIDHNNIKENEFEGYCIPVKQKMDVFVKNSINGI